MKTAPETSSLPDDRVVTPSGTLNIWIFDDHQCFRDLLSDHLSTLPQTWVVGCGDDQENLFAAVDRHEVDLVLLDLHLPNSGGFGIMEALMLRASPPAVVILSSQVTPHSVNTAIRLGAVGYLQKTAGLDEIETALEQIRLGRTYFGQGTARDIGADVKLKLDRRGSLDLTTREVRLLSRLARGDNAKELGAAMNISPFTVYKMRTVLMDKIGVKTQRELVDYALRNGLMGWHQSV
jgi:DNA-binding NarL/FixJ family response regulator